MALPFVKHNTHVQHHSSSMQVLLPGKRRCSCSRRAPVSTKQTLAVCCNQQREVGCSELYNMTEAIKAQGELDQATQSSGWPSSSDVSQLNHHNEEAVQADSNVDQPAVTGTGTKRGVGYYAGLVTTDLQVDNKASGADMLKRNLQLAGGVAGLLALLTYLFLASNKLV